jgi:hypothetical protein
MGDSGRSIRGGRRKERRMGGSAERKEKGRANELKEDGMER